jgi:integrase/recombinase XerD
MRNDPHKAIVERSGFYRYMQAFLEWTEVKGYSRDTLRRRRAALKRFIVWCDERELQSPQEITKPILERYQRYLYYYRKSDGQPLTFGSQNVMLTPLKTFFKWLTRENHILYNPASELDVPPKPKRLPKTILPPETIESILNQPDVTTVEGLRDRTILEVLYSTGIRRMELVKLTLYDVDHRRGTLMIREGKGKKDRLIPIGERALAWTEKYRHEGRPALVVGKDGGTLFLTDQGIAFRRGALGARIKRYIRQAGIEVEGSCHLFRHAMATHMLENGADIRFIQAMLGHEDLSTTEIYTQVSIEKLRQIHAATHPARLNKLTRTTASDGAA